MPSAQFQSLIPSITERLRGVQEGVASVEHIIPFKPSTDMRLIEGVLFLKPEATDLINGVDVEQVLQMLGKYIKEWDLQVDGLSIMGAEYLKRHDIIAQHYGVLNSISRHGTSVIADSAKKKLEEIVAKEASRPVLALGAHQCMERFPEFSPSILNSIAENVQIDKLAPGTYCTKWVYNETLLLLLNAFHPYQLEHFTAPQRAIIVLVVRSSGEADGQPWRTLRNEMLGVTDPEAANSGSLRRLFLEKRAELKIGTINRGYNAVHFSAGPLEGMVETIRYFSDYENQRTLDLSTTSFGQLLLNTGFDRPTIERLMKNPQLSIRGVQVPAFDLCEEIQPLDAVRQLKEAIENKAGE
jgi:hypothetical protein